MNIVGAGLAGLIAGHVFPNCSILERQAAPTQTHRALLRFRDESVSHVTGIPFRKVRVRKGIYDTVEGRFVNCDIQQANRYAAKVSGMLVDRSIWDQAPVDRFIAPDDLHERLLSALQARILWGFDAGNVMRDAKGMRNPCISTAPIFETLLAVDPELSASIDVEFKRAPITVRRVNIKDADVYQTVYFPSDDTTTYRASMTGSTLIIESVGDLEEQEREMHIAHVMAVFGIPPKAGTYAHAMESVVKVQQSFGKISPIDNKLRKELIHRLTVEHNIYSVGRFATWRNILLDDVVKDLRIAKEMIEQQDTYANHLSSVA